MHCSELSDYVDRAKAERINCAKVEKAVVVRVVAKLVVANNRLSGVISALPKNVATMALIWKRWNHRPIAVGF